jgi:MFS-type transporter involved in bile tolerance (Atg22 family)
LKVMDTPQWGYALFDAGCWGYASVTVSTLAPLVFVRRIREAMPMSKFAKDVWAAGETEEQAIWNVSAMLVCPRRLFSRSLPLPCPRLTV